MKKIMIALLATGLFTASCSKDDVLTINTDPPPNNISLAPVLGRWEVYKRDDLTGTGIILNAPKRDTVTVNSNKTYTWKSPSGTITGTVYALNNTEFRLYENGNTNNWFNTLLRVSGNELTGETLFLKYYLRKI